jgi:Ca2+-transporting ATPase
MRVLAYGFRKLEKISEPLDYADIEKDLQFAGLVGMIDPPREEIKAAIKECKTAGIHVVMITGDHIETATAIAKKLACWLNLNLVISGC